MRCTQWTTWGSRIGLLLMLTGCGAATSLETTAQTAESSETSRAVTGSVPTTAEANLASGVTKHANHGGQSSTTAATAESDSSCAADTIVATDTSGGTVTAAVAADCSFSLSLEVGESYVLSFSLDDAFVATLVFDGGIDGATNNLLPLGASASGISLGSITISGTTASPQHDPLSQNDRDGDGANDLADEDDDDDGVTDDEEDDCDFDGIPDDVDREKGCLSEDHGDLARARILAVKPAAWHGHRVDLEKTVKLLVSCRVDPESVNATTFQVVSDGGDVVACDYEYGFWRHAPQFLKHLPQARRHIVKCEHRADPFLVNTEYHAIINGLRCMDGRLVERMRWSWMTEESDHSVGCYEDDIEDASEMTDDEVEAQAEAEVEAEAEAEVGSESSTEAASDSAAAADATSDASSGDSEADASVVVE